MMYSMAFLFWKSLACRNESRLASIAFCCAAIAQAQQAF
jgi:hypothetical protein